MRTWPSRYERLRQTLLDFVFRIRWARTPAEIPLPPS